MLQAWSAPLWHWLLFLLVMAGSMARADVTPCVPEDFSSITPRFNLDFQTDVYSIISVRCATCHTNGGSSGALNMDPETAYDNLVGQDAANTLPQLQRIHPFEPQRSFLFKKVNCTNLNSIPSLPYGRRMPRTGPPYLSLADQATIHDWILQGATRQRDPDRLFASRFNERD